jgi:glycosyltransferase involved in cell wall biosynthesis
VRLCFVVQRFGTEVTGGAEAHCRGLARRLARAHETEVLTTCALDYGTWANHYPPGRQTVDGLPVTRFKVARPRSVRDFAFYSDVVFRDRFTRADELRWIEENGPFCPALVSALRGLDRVDLFVFYSYRYYTAFHGLPAVAPRAVLVPTAEDDQAVRLPVFRELLRRPRGLLYLTPEERALVQEVTGNADVPSAIVGGGVDVAPGWESPDARSRFSLPPRYLLYVGRIDWSKGVDRLFDYYRRLAEAWPEVPPLVLAGKAMLEIPSHPGILYLGEVAEVEKFALIGGCELLLLPSLYESLSIAVLEAWALGKPVLVNGECRVLEGQCIRSNGGLYYRGLAEFAQALRLLLERPGLREAMGRSGRAYVEREHGWDLVEERARVFLEEVAGRAAPRGTPTRGLDEH